MCYGSNIWGCIGILSKIGHVILGVILSQTVANNVSTHLVLLLHKKIKTTAFKKNCGVHQIDLMKITS